MPLNLQGDSTLPQVFTGGFSVDNLSWWFWIKAGIGFVFGAWVSVLVLFVPTFVLYLWFITFVLSAATRGLR